MHVGADCRAVVPTPPVCNGSLRSTEEWKASDPPAPVIGPAVLLEVEDISAVIGS